MSKQQVIDTYVEKLETIYNNRTAGDHTYSGLLYDFLRDFKATESYTNARVTAALNEARKALADWHAAKAVLLEVRSTLESEETKNEVTPLK